MRIPVLLTACMLMAAAGTVTAQDLQYRMIMKTDMPGMRVNTPMPQPTVSMYVKGTRMRIDTEVSIGMPDPPALPEVMKMSVITDAKAGKMFMLNHIDKEYQEVPYSISTMNLDSAQRQQLSELKPNIKQTGDTLTINGYATKRFVATMEMPTMPLPQMKQDSGKAMMIMETWTSSDAKLIEAHGLMRSTMATMQGQGDPTSALMNQVAGDGFPLRTTVLLLSVPPNAALDVDRALKAGAAAQGLQMRMVMEASDIKLVPLADALFEVPKDYVKK
jgi:hypothetical protein